MYLTPNYPSNMGSNFTKIKVKVKVKFTLCPKEKLNKWKPPHCNKGEVENQAQSIFLKLVRCHWHAVSEIVFSSCAHLLHLR